MVFAGFTVRRIEKKEIKGFTLLVKPLDSRQHFTIHQAISGFNLQGRKVLADHLGGGETMTDKDYFVCAAAEGLHPDRTGAGIGIEKSGAAHAGPQHIEECLAHLIGSRPDERTFERLYPLPTFCA